MADGGAGIGLLCQSPCFLLAQLEAAGAGSAILSHCHIVGGRNSPAKPQKDAELGCAVPRGAECVSVCEVSCAICYLLLDYLGVSAAPLGHCCLVGGRNGPAEH